MKKGRAKKRGMLFKDIIFIGENDVLFMRGIYWSFKTQKAAKNI